MAVLFDLDGTLIDSAPAIYASLRHVERALGCTPQDDLRWALGPPLHEIASRLLQTNDVEQVAAAVRCYREHHPTVCLTHARPYPGVSELLAGLNAAGHSLFVATSKLQTVGEEVLLHFGLHDYFQGVHGAQVDGTRASKEEVIAHVLRVHRLDAATSVMVGDRFHDVLAAHALGLRSVGVLYGYGSREELTQSDALCATVDDVGATVLAMWTASVL